MSIKCKLSTLMGEHRYNIQNVVDKTGLSRSAVSNLYHDRTASIEYVTFGKDVEYGGGAPSVIANIIWLLVSGIPLAAACAINGLLLCLTIIGIPFGLQCFKIAKLALMPFGARIVYK